MPRGKRYSADQKEQMKEKALALHAEGKTQKDIAAALGITVITLKSVLGTAVAPAALAAPDAPRPKRGRPPAQEALPASHPAVQLALKHQRIAEIERQVTALAEEKATLEADLKASYKQLGADLFGKKTT